MKARDPAAPVRRAPPAPPQERDYAWQLGQVMDARNGFSTELTQPGRFRRDLPGLVKVRRRWLEMCGRRKPRPNGRYAAPVDDVLLGLSGMLRPNAGFKEAFIPVYNIERRNFCRPWLATGVHCVWVDKASVADDPRHWKGESGSDVRQAGDVHILQMLPEHMLIEDILHPGQVRNLPDDPWHVDGNATTIRRAANRELLGNGTLAGQVDVVPEETRLWEKYLLHICGLAFLITAIAIALFTSGG